MLIQRCNFCFRNIIMELSYNECFFYFSPSQHFLFVSQCIIMTDSHRRLTFLRHLCLHAFIKNYCSSVGFYHANILPGCFNALMLTCDKQSYICVSPEYSNYIKQFLHSKKRCCSLLTERLIKYPLKL